DELSLRRHPLGGEGEDGDSRDPAEEDHCSEDVHEEREVPRIGSEERDHPPAPGFQIMSTRTAKPSTAAPKSRNSTSGSRSADLSSALGWSPSAARRSASSIPGLPRSPPTAPKDVGSTHTDK